MMFFECNPVQDSEKAKKKILAKTSNATKSIINWVLLFSARSYIVSTRMLLRCYNENCLYV